MYNVLYATRYRIFLPVVAGIFLLFSCDASLDDSGGSDAPGPAPAHEVLLDSSGNGSVTLTGLANNDAYLVKVNASESPRTASVIPAPSASGEEEIRVPAGTVTIDGQTFIRYERQWQIKIPADDMPLANRSVVSDYTTAQVGDTKPFYVDATLSTKEATLRKIGEHCKIWVDNDRFNNGSTSENDNSVTEEQINALAEKFDKIYSLETNLVGYEYGGGLGGNGGVDGDPQIQILVYDIDGDYGNHENGITYGYFYPVDEFLSYPYSNKAEIFYLDSEMLDADPDTVYSVLIHEFNHMINFNLKVLETDDDSNYETWYTEMLSMLAEDAIGPLVGIPYLPSSPNGHVIHTRILYWLVSYMDYGAMQWTDEDALFYYSSNYAFGAYLVRNFGGPELLSRIAKSPKGGRDSLDESLRALNGPSVDTQYAMTRFGEALVYSGNAKPAGGYSFDKTVTGYVGKDEYTFSGFDIWKMQYTLGGEGPFKGPSVFLYKEGVANSILPYTVQLFSRDDWQNKSAVTINVVNGNPDVHYFVMTR
jgi:hypothetical protein